jgi:hypothetical protein
LLKKNKIKLTEKMPNLLLCKGLRKKHKLLLKSLVRKLMKKQNSKDNGMLSWLKELNKKRKIRKQQSLLSNRKLQRIKQIKKLPLPSRRPNKTLSKLLLLNLN